MRLLFIFMTFFAFMISRDSPFDKSVSSDFQVKGQNSGEMYLSDINVKLPSSARMLKNITIEYVNIDGSTERKKIDVNKTIDWHYPLQISQYEAMRNIVRRYFSLNDFEFFMEGKKIVIYSKYQIKRHFLMAGPIIAIDYARNGNPAYSGKIKTGEKYFSEVSVQTKDNTYRVLINLDGVYEFQFSNANNTQIIGIK